VISTSFANPGQMLRQRIVGFDKLSQQCVYHFLPSKNTGILWSHWQPIYQLNIYNMGRKAGLFNMVVNHADN
jgi:hypothetical protein